MCAGLFNRLQAGRQCTPVRETFRLWRRLRGSKFDQFSGEWLEEEGRRGGWYLPVKCDNQVPNFLVNFGFGKSRGCVVFD